MQVPVKGAPSATDTYAEMMISDEQVRLVAAHLRETAGDPGGEPAAPRSTVDVSPELLERVRDSLLGLPETRRDRVQHARDLVSAGGASAREVADKMLGREISDSLK